MYSWDWSLKRRLDTVADSEGELGEIGTRQLFCVLASICEVHVIKCVSFGARERDTKHFRQPSRSLLTSLCETG